MTNPFEDEQGSFLVLANEQRQRCIWPEFSPVPAGWNVEYGPETRVDCLSYIERVWTDISPSKPEGIDQ